MQITILRLGHRKERDKRITTHCALVARALGANNIIFSGEYDPTLDASVKGVVSNWGGKFTSNYKEDFLSEIEKAKRNKTLIVHLTFYGLEFPKAIKQIKKQKPSKVMIIIGAEKVPTEVYELADINMSIGNQPHSEVAALALTLYELTGKDSLYSEQKGWKVKITPTIKGKITKFRGKKTKKRR